MARSVPLNRRELVLFVALAISCAKPPDAELRAEEQPRLTREDSGRRPLSGGQGAQQTKPDVLGNTASGTVAIALRPAEVVPISHSMKDPTQQPAAIRDAFGSTADEDGFYSKKLHLDLASSDPIQRSHVRLEQDSNGTLHLRLSKLDIEQMPRLDEVLPPLAPGTVDPTIGSGDPFVPELQLVEWKADDEGISTWEKLVVAPPLRDYRLELSGGSSVSKWSIEAKDSVSGKALWSHAIDMAPDLPYPRIEFARDSPKRFYLCDQDRWAMLFDLDRGHLCTWGIGKMEGIKADYVLWPAFASDRGESLLFVKDLKLWLASGRSCREEVVGSTSPDYPPEVRQVTNGDIAFSGDRRLAWVITPYYAPTQSTPRALVPRTLVFRLLERRSAKRWESARTISVRVIDNQKGLGVVAVARVSEPFLQVSVACPGAISLQWREPPSPAGCFLLVANGRGSFFVSRSMEPLGASVSVDEEHAAVKTGQRWWDLRPWANWSPPDNDYMVGAP